MTSLPRPCITCGVLTHEAYCAEHTPPKRLDQRRGRQRSTRGRGQAWILLSRRARSLQDWCTDCGSRDNLQADHLPSAWFKIMNRQPVTLADVEVVCGPCNIARGPAIPGSARYERWLAIAGFPAIQGRPQGGFEAREGYCAPRVQPRTQSDRLGSGMSGLPTPCHTPHPAPGSSLAIGVTAQAHLVPFVGLWILTIVPGVQPQSAFPWFGHSPKLPLRHRDSPDIMVTRA